VSLGAGAPVHSYADVSIAPSGSHVVAIESDEAKVEGGPERHALVIRPVDGSPPKTVALPCAPDPDCVPSQPVWSPDGTYLVFVSKSPKAKTRALYRVDAAGTGLRRLLIFDGVLNDPRFSPGGRLAVLATAGAHKEIGATQAGAPIVGEIGTKPDEQRIALVDPSGALHWASPPDLFVYEYDWKPDGSGFVGTAAHGNGDNNWWVAHIYAFDAANAAATDLYAPASPQQQIASPRISGDGKTIAFIGGIMSDFGSTGGDVYALPIAGGSATDVTLGMKASATSLAWACPNGADPNRLSFTALDGARYAMHDVWPLTQRPQQLGYSFGETFATDMTVACGGTTANVAFVRQSFEAPPEIFVGSNFADVHALSHANAGAQSPARAQSVSWEDDGLGAQGWLLAPLGNDPNLKHPMITLVHGGPAGASVPRFIGRGLLRDLLNGGYYLFLPNPRGSFGQGEAFTLANVKDFGYGDLRDDLTGIDAVEKITAGAVDNSRLGITGGSYGGFMTMWAVTQTNRFKAAVAGAGISDWISYYGENGIDEWMIPFFGSSAYDDPAVYRKSSPIEFIKNVKTPTFEFVGEHDVECPAPQSLEFWHALETLGVPTQLVIYPGEGHHLREPEHIADVTRRTVDWFKRYLK
jgi:dipeptidyl aminopeptidase/acylaminoacyl peptidase